MFGICLDVAYACANAHRVQKEKRQSILDGLSPEARASYLAIEEGLRIESIAERRHRELCVSIEKAGKNSCFW